jgi:hypothetical protein
MFTRRTVLRGSAALASAALVTRGLRDVATGASLAGGAAFDWGDFSAEARPWTRWWWLGSAVTPSGLRSHLNEFAAVGIGGVEIQPIYEAQDHPERVRSYLSPEWLEALDATLSQARRLGLGVDVTTGSGWNFGGPWLEPELSAGRVLTKRWVVEGGQRLQEAVTVQGPPHPGLVDEERLAIPEFRPPMPEPPQPKLAALAARESTSREVVVLTDRVNAEGVLDWTAPEGRWELTGVFSGLLLKRVERAGPGGKGLMADFFNKTSIRKHLEHFAHGLGRRRTGIRALFNDSFEIEGTNWSPATIEEFTRLRGFDLAPFLPELFAPGPLSPTALRVQSDVRETLSDMFIEQFADTWTSWSARHGWLTRNQSHGSPAHLLDLWAAVDIPETEYAAGPDMPIPGLRRGPRTAHTPRPLSWRMAASAAHTQGRRLVSAEVLTLRDEHYHVGLSQVRPQIDALFAAGINHVIFHGTAYTPEDAPWPGYSFYAATELKPANPIWKTLPHLTAYITRCQSVLQDGQHGNDVLVYWPQHDLWAMPGGGTGRTALDLAPKYNWEGYTWADEHPSGLGGVVGGMVNRGWQLDWISDRQLTQFRQKSGRLTNGHSAYVVVVVPGARLMPLQTLQRLSDLASAGATVVFTGALPEDVPGLGDLDNRRAQFHELLHDIGADSGPGEYTLGRGKVVVAADAAALDAALAAATAVRVPLADSGLRVLRRRHNHGHLYFLANHTDRAVDGWWQVGEDAASVVALDPLTDGRGTVPTRRREGTTEVRLRLLPGETIILRSFESRKVDGRKHPLLLPTGNDQPLDGPWTLEFIDGGPSIPRSRELDELVSWTQLGDEEAAFSGTARYTIRFEGPTPSRGRTWLLDLGDVRESARVRVNGQEIGTAWAIPFRIPLAGLREAGENVLELEVTSTAANRVRDLARRGDLATPFYMSWRTTAPTQWAPAPSGLLGLVRLVEVGDHDE